VNINSVNMISVI